MNFFDVIEINNISDSIAMPATNGKQTNKDKEKMKGKEKEITRENEEAIEKAPRNDKEKAKGKAKEKIDKEKKKGIDKEKELDKEIEREREKERATEKEREKEIATEKEKARAMEKEKERAKERAMEKEKEREKEIAMEKEKARAMEKDKEREKEKERAKERAMEKEKEREKERERAKEIETAREKVRERATETEGSKRGRGRPRLSTSSVASTLILTENEEDISRDASPKQNKRQKNKTSSGSKSAYPQGLALELATLVSQNIFFYLILHKVLMFISEIHIFTKKKSQEARTSSSLNRGKSSAKARNKNCFSFYLYVSGMHLVLTFHNFYLSFSFFFTS